MIPDVELPRIDTHGIEIAAPPDVVWEALASTFERDLSGRAAGAVAWLTGVRDRPGDGPPFPQAGAAVTGFRVAESAPGRRLRLEGQHRFSRYALEFELRATGSGATRLEATSHAAFPGPAGAVYRALVIGTRGHVLAVRRMLHAARVRAEAA